MEEINIRVHDGPRLLGERSFRKRIVFLFLAIIASILATMMFYTDYKSQDPQTLENSSNRFNVTMDQNYINTAWSMALLGSLCVLGILTVEFFRRFILLARELQLRKKRYNNNIREVMSTTLKTKFWRQEVFTMVVSLMLVVTVLYCNPNYWREMLLQGMLSMIMLTVVWIIVYFFDIPRNLQMSPVEKKMGPRDNVGAALVWSYYYGYLKLILPSLKQRARDYETKNNGVFMPVHKLFILMPESCFAPKRLDENPPDRDLLEHAQNLEPVIMPRAGNAKREYQTPVYKIMAADKPVYCIAEIPAFMEAMREMVKQASETTFNEELKNIWLDQARQVLSKIIKRDDACRESAEIIYYKDKLQDGQFCRISEVLMDRIGLIRSLEVKNRP